MAEARKSTEMHDRKENVSREPHRLHPVTEPIPGAEAASEIVQQTTAQAEEAMAWGMRTISGLNTPFADAGLEQARKAVETTARVSEAYREAAEHSSEDVKALMAAFSHCGRGVQQWQHACFDLTQQWMKRAADQRSTFMRARTPVELAEAQRDLYLSMVNTMFTANSTLLQLAGRISQDAVRPLEERTRDAA